MSSRWSAATRSCSKGARSCVAGSKVTGRGTEQRCPRPPCDPGRAEPRRSPESRCSHQDCGLRSSPRCCGSARRRSYDRRRRCKRRSGSARRSRALHLLCGVCHRCQVCAQKLLQTAEGIVDGDALNQLAVGKVFEELLVQLARLGHQAVVGLRSVGIEKAVITAVATSLIVRKGPGSVCHIREDLRLRDVCRPSVGVPRR